MCMRSPSMPAPAPPPPPAPPQEARLPDAPTGRRRRTQNARGGFSSGTMLTGGPAGASTGSTMLGQ